MTESKTTNFYPQAGATYRAHTGELFVVQEIATSWGEDEADIVLFKHIAGNGITWAHPVTTFGEDFDYVQNV